MITFLQIHNQKMRLNKLRKKASEINNALASAELKYEQNWEKWAKQERAKKSHKLV